MSEKELISEIQRTLAEIAEKDPSWRLLLGRESLSSSDVIVRLKNDRKLRRLVLKHYIGLAIEMDIRARRQLFGEETSDC